MANNIGRGFFDEGRDPEWKVRVGGGAKREPSVDARLARLRGGRSSGGGSKRSSGGGGGKRHGGSKGRGTMPYGATNARSQRVVVKVLSRRHHQGKSGGLSRHVSYLGRDGAGAEGERGTFYSAEQDVVDARATTKEWQEDKHHFRMIVSPENAADIADLSAYVRDMMQRVEQDLGLPSGSLEWIAVNHHNTGNPHAHVLIRGADQSGDELFIRREYVAHGFRGRAAEAATELLGERTEKELQRSRAREVEAERFTSLDRTIERGMERGTFDTSPGRRIGFRRDDRPLVVARLQHLERMGLAEKDRASRWRIKPDFKRALMQMGMRNDIIRQLYSTLGRESTYVRHEPIVEPVAGVVVVKGAVDEIGTQRFVVVRDRANVLHYAKVNEGEAFRTLRVGDEAELGRGTHTRREIARQVAQATGRDGRYANKEHERQLLLANRGSAQAALRWAQTAGRQVEAWADRPESGIQRTREIGVHRVDRKAFERFIQRQASRGVTDVRNLTAERERARERGRDMGRG